VLDNISGQPIKSRPLRISSKSGFWDIKSTKEDMISRKLITNPYFEILKIP
jgi:hypothetical protein